MNETLGKVLTGAGAAAAAAALSYFGLASPETLRADANRDANFSHVKQLAACNAQYIEHLKEEH